MLEHPARLTTTQYLKGPCPIVTEDCTAATVEPPNAGVPTLLALKQAVGLFEEIAGAAAQIDRSCHFALPDLGSEPVDPEEVLLELDRLRQAVRRIGWMSNLGCAKLRGDELVRGGVRGNAERCLIWPRDRLP